MRGTFGRLLRLASPFAGWMVLAALLGFATVGSSIGLMTTAAYIISKAATGYRLWPVAAGYWLWPVSAPPSIADLEVAIAGVRLFGIARGGFRYLERYVSHQVTFRLLARLRVWFYAALEPLAPARLQQYRSGDLLARIVADVETLQDFYLRVLAPPAVAVLVALLAALLVGSFYPALAVTLLAFLLLAGAGLPLLTQALGRPAGRQMVQVRADLSSRLMDGIQGAADLLACGQEHDHYEQVASLDRRLGRLQGQMARIGGLHAALSGLAMNLATLAVLAVAIPLVHSAALDGLALLVLAVMSSFEAVLPLPHAFQYLENSLEAARRLFEIVDVEPAGGREYGNPEIGESWIGDGLQGSSPRFPDSPLPQFQTCDLHVADLCFAYEAAGPLVLDDIGFDLPQGGWLAIVGPSGAGKTTLVRLLLRFWDYSSGRILLGGRELRDLGQEEVRQTMAVVSQHTHLFNTTVRENLLLARPGASEAELVDAARQAQIDEFIRSLPQGYDTWIGEQGVRLSGGQRQRLAIARALLKDAPILILDEPTANLDALTERDVMAALRGLMAGRTTLTISHRLVGLEEAGEILVLESGRIAQRGRHQDLVARKGLYQRMWELQHQILALPE
jgi:thiol reductant ABC exporter CydC subunit